MLAILIIALCALAVAAYFRNRQENRRIDRHNRMIDKQEELLESLRDTDPTKTDENE
jgi:hypothetical protein